MGHLSVSVLTLSHPHVLLNVHLHLHPRYHNYTERYYKEPLTMYIAHYFSQGGFT